jgi:hypothetical protein
MSQTQFTQASWDWVQDATTATHKWGLINRWDVSAVTDMAYAFSTFRAPPSGGTSGSDQNPKAATFNSDISDWDTGLVTR